MTEGVGRIEVKSLYIRTIHLLFEPPFAVERCQLVDSCGSAFFQALIEQLTDSIHADMHQACERKRWVTDSCRHAVAHQDLKRPRKVPPQFALHPLNALNVAQNHSNGVGDGRVGPEAQATPLKVVSNLLRLPFVTYGPRRTRTSIKMPASALEAESQRLTYSIHGGEGHPSFHIRIHEPHHPVL